MYSKFSFREVYCLICGQIFAFNVMHKAGVCLIIQYATCCECSGSVVECLTQDGGAMGSSLNVLCP